MVLPELRRLMLSLTSVRKSLPNLLAVLNLRLMS